MRADNGLGPGEQVHPGVRKEKPEDAAVIPVLFGADQFALDERLDDDVHRGPFNAEKAGERGLRNAGIGIDEPQAGDFLGRQAQRGKVSFQLKGEERIDPRDVEADDIVEPIEMTGLRAILLGRRRGGLCGIELR